MTNATYGEKLRIAWLIVWRGLFAYFLVGAALALVVGVPGKILGLGEGPILIVAWSMAIPGIIFVTIPWVVHMMLRKKFSGFQVAIVRPPDEGIQPHLPGRTG